VTKTYLADLNSPYGAVNASEKLLHTPNRSTASIRWENANIHTDQEDHRSSDFVFCYPLICRKSLLIWSLR
jgi:hypothetical protein